MINAHFNWLELATRAAGLASKDCSWISGISNDDLGGSNYGWASGASCSECNVLYGASSKEWGTWIVATLLVWLKLLLSIGSLKHLIYPQVDIFEGLLVVPVLEALQVLQFWNQMLLREVCHLIA
jgi:hypothetical protein